MDGELIVANETSPRGEADNQLIKLTDEQQKKFEDGWRKLDACETGLFSGYVEYGRVLREIRRINKGHYLSGLARRGMASSSAQRFIDLAEACDGFNAADMDRAARLGPTRIRELKVALGAKGVHALIEHGRCCDAQGLVVITLETAEHSSVAKLIEWKAAYRTQAHKKGGHDDTGDLDREQAEMLANRKPLELEIATDEVIGGLVRAQLELPRVKDVVEALLPPENDNWKEARVEVAHAARRILDAIVTDAKALDADLAERFGLQTMPSNPFAHQTLAHSQLDALGNFALESAEADTRERYIQRSERLVPKPKGAPPKTLDALLKKFEGDSNA